MRKVLLYLILLSLIITGCSSAGPTVPADLPPVSIPAPPTPPITPLADRPDAQDAGPRAVPTRDDNPAAAATSPDADSLQPPPTPTAILPPGTTAQYTVSAAPGVPIDLIKAAQDIAANNRQLFSWVDDDLSADVLLTVNDGVIITRPRGRPSPTAGHRDHRSWASYSSTRRPPRR